MPFLIYNLLLYCMRSIYVEIGNAAKAKICLNLVKKFCGDGVQFKDIENQVNQIKSNALAVRIEGKFAFVELNWIELNWI